MTVLLAILDRRRLVATLVALLVAVGAAAWWSMPRQEDPSFEQRFGSLVVPWPGADPLRVERLVVRPIEDALADVPQIRKLEATARSGVAVFTIELGQDIYATDEAWDEVREALDRAEADLPDGSGPMDLDNDIGDPASVVLAITGSDDLLVLRQAARTLEEALLSVPGVSRVERIADPGEQVSVRVDPALADRLGLDSRSLAATLQSRNTVLPGGSLQVDGRTAVLSPRAELPGVTDFRDTPWVLADGSAVPLGELAQVVREPTTPAAERMVHDGLPAVALAVVPDLPQDLVTFGQRVDTTLQGVLPSLDPDLRVDVFSSQPAMVAERLGSLTRTLLLGVLIVAAVLLTAMGPRLGVVVASVVPLVALSTMAVYAFGGGILHQISISALVLALGLLVDNAIVVAETVQRHIDEGAAPAAAARQAVRELAVPLGTATGTTVAAFVPMLLASGPTSDFTRAIPIVVMIALVLSFLFALAVTPTLSALLLRPGAEAEGRLDASAHRLGQAVVQRPWQSLGLVGAMLALALALLPAVQQQFFPMSDRARLVVTVELPEGAHLSNTEAVVADLQRSFGELDDVSSVTSFIGRGPPRFYYNLNNTPSSPHAATLVVSTADAGRLPALVSDVRRLARDVPQATIVPRRLQQGPPVGAPIEVRLTSPDLEDLQAASDAVVQILRDMPEARDVRTDLGVGLPSLTWDIDDASAGRRGLARRDVALSLLARTQGLDAGEARGGREPVPVVVTTPAGQRTAVSALGTTTVNAPGGRSAPLSAVAAQDISWGPAAVRRLDRQRVVTVSAELAEGASFSAVTGRRDELQQAVPGSVTVAFGGEAEGSVQANNALLSTLPIGIGLLLLFLLLEFDSFRRVGIVLVTVPLAGVGVIPGLALSGQPFGFMSFLGVIALVGVVVNNAIVLLDVVESRRKGGASIEDAVADAVRVRTRPILLTTGTTVAGMLPLALSSSPLWPPLAWAMISGLVASTALTLVAVPALYRLWLGERGSFGGIGRAATVATALMLVAAPAQGAEITFEEALERGASAPASDAASRAARASAADATAARFAAFGPSVGGQITSWRRDSPLEVQIPQPIGGAFVQQPDALTTLGAEANLPLLDPAAIAALAPAGRAAKAARHDAVRSRQLSSLAAGEGYLDVLAVDAQTAAVQATVASLASLYEDLQARQAADLVVAADVLRVQVALLDARQRVAQLQRQRQIAALRLGSLLGSAEAMEPAGLPPAIEVASGAVARQDLAALDDRVRALRATRNGVWAEALPRLEAYGSYARTDQDNLVDADWVEGGVRATWTPIARGTRPARARAAGQRLAEAEARREQLALGIEVEQLAATTAVTLAATEVAARTTAVTQATAARDQVSDRYQQGLATLTDVLQVEAELSTQLTRLRVAEIEAVRAALRQRVALGLDP
ncbi:MAG: efflux RND transporter permease subunit [Myxococcales bacterium]|nr:efflux RND transporter permease subunit [Myxococcales bacterium]